MYAAIVKALTDTNGPDFSGQIVPMPSGTYHLVSKAALPFFNGHPDVFQVTYEADDAYPGLLSTDAYNNTVLKASDGRNIVTGPTRMIKASNSWLDDQPAGVTSPCRSMGSLVCRFKAAEWPGYGAAQITAHDTNITDTTGYDAYGIKTGSLINGVGTGPVSLTGQSSLMKFLAVGTANLGIGAPSSFASTVKTVALNGKIGLYVYVEGSSVGTTTLTLELSTTGSAANGLVITWSSACMRPGWNFLTFVMRNPQAYIPASGVAELHPTGVMASSNGTGAGTNILTTAINFMRIYCGVASTTVPIYFDSLWTGFDTKAQYLLGFDSSEQSIIDYAVPRMRHKGYAAVNLGSLYYDGTNRLATLYDNFTPRLDTLYAAGWEITNHTTFHLPGTQASPTMATLTDAAEIAYEVKQMQAAMLSKGWTRGQHFYVSPQSSSSALSERVIGDCGYPLQRNSAASGCIQITPFGIPNPRACGSFGIGSTAQTTHVTIGGVASLSTTLALATYGYQLIDNSKAVVDMVIAYGATWMPFSHGLEDVDDGTGNQTPTDSTKMKLSHFNMLMDYMDAKEDAGLITGLDGSDHLWYGANAQ